MDYISYPFVFFLAVTLLGFYLVKKRHQWKILLIASIVFYMSAGVSNIVYILLLSLCTWITARYLGKRRNAIGKMKFILIAAVLLNIGLLIFLKWGGLGVSLLNRMFGRSWGWKFVLPLGISFFTFQNAGYLIDVYRGKCKAEKSYWRYLLFSTYFPYIFSGPINRYGTLAGQFYTPKTWNWSFFYCGILRILWGMLKKLILADRAAVFVNEVFNQYYMYRGAYIVMAVVLFTLQLYMDFSGCMDIVLGISKLFQVELPENFAAPFSARSTADFWRRWHITLSAWFRDYIYIPLGGNRNGKIKKYINIMVVFLFCGMWHGSGITFLIWGGLNGIYQIIGDITESLRKRFCKVVGLGTDTFGAGIRKSFITFVLGEIAWLFFRADGLREALYMLRRMVTGWNPWIFTDGGLFSVGLDGLDFVILAVGTIFVGMVSKLNIKKDLQREFLRQSPYFQYVIVSFSVFLLYLFGIYGPGFDASGFIYYNF